MLWKPRENRSLTEISAKISHGLIARVWLYPRRSVQIRGKSVLKNKCGRASHPTASFVDLSRLPSRRLGRRADGTGPTALTSECHFYRYGCRALIQRIISLQPLWWPAAQPAPKSRKWRRPQCPGNRFALTRVSECPLAIHPRELPAATGVTAIIVRQALRNPTFSLNPLCARS